MLHRLNRFPVTTPEIRPTGGHAIQNKRGISQVFSPTKRATDSLVRDATVFDVFDISRVLIESITQLCQADHGNDPDMFAEWIANKSPEDIRLWIESGSILSVCDWNGRISAVGLAQANGGISLLYVAPDAVGHGLGRVLLQALEAQLWQAGHRQIHLTATRSALSFYQSQGWSRSGPATNCFGLPGQPMRKLLQPAG